MKPFQNLINNNYTVRQADLECNTINFMRQKVRLLTYWIIQVLIKIKVIKLREYNSSSVVSNSI